MALLWIDGFDKYGTATNATNPQNVLSWKYLGLNVDHVDIEAGRFSGNCINIQHTSTIVGSPDLCPADTTLIVGFSFKWSAIADGNWLIDFRLPSSDGETVGWGELTFKVGGTTNGAPIYVNRGNTTLNTTANGAFGGINTDTWYYFEAKVLCDASVGTINCYIDGVEVLTFSGNTKHGSSGGDRYTRFRFRQPFANNLYIDDLYAADGTGSGVNDVLGNWQVSTLSPTSDASGNWVPSTGSDLFAVVDENILDANYISSDASGNQAVFETTNLSANAATGTVKGAMITCDSVITGNSAKYAKTITQNGSGGSITDTGNFMPGVANPAGYGVIMENDPDGNAWSPSTVNDFRMGVEVS